MIGWFQLNICLFFLWSTKFAFFGTNTSFLLRYIKIWFCVELLIISNVSLFSWPCPKINAIQTSVTSSHYIKEVLIGRGVYAHMHMYMCKKKKIIVNYVLFHWWQKRLRTGARKYFRANQRTSSIICFKFYTQLIWIHFEKNKQT